MQKTKRKKLLIVDDHPMMREGLAQLISQQPDLAVAGEADTAHAALELIPKVNPDLLLVDITLPGKSGLELIKDVKVMFPNLLILVISMHDESLYAERVLKAGARGYIMKQEGGKKLLEAMRHVLEGKVYVSPNISSRILEIFSGVTDANTRKPVEQLTDREFEVFELIGQGLEVKDIADKLNLSVKTVEVHRTNIKEKLKAKSVGELIRQAVRWVDSQNKS